MDQIFPKDIWVLPMYFLNFSFYAVVWQSIVDLGCYGCKGYTRLVLGYSWGKGGCSPLSICLLCFGYIQHCSIGALCYRIPFSSILLGVFKKNIFLMQLSLVNENFFISSDTYIFRKRCLKMLACLYCTVNLE